MVIFLAPIFTKEILDEHVKTSPAASFWCTLFTKSLKKQTEMCCIYAVNSTMFPIGDFFVKGYTYNHPIATKLVSYIGLPFLRYYLIDKKIKKQIDIHLHESDVKYVITYNTTKQNIRAAKYLQSKEVKWVSIYADANTDAELFSDADYHIYFSYSSFIRSNYKNKINFEGAIYKNFPSNYIENNNKIFLYTGTIRKENGVDLMLESFKLLEDKDARLKITGRGNYEGFIKKVNSDSRIQYLGMVDQSELNSLYSEASFFLNPRLSCYEENNNNFPSKLLDYLSFGKPIISTKSAGINPSYYNYLYFLENENIEELSDLMRVLILKTSEEKKELFLKIKEYGIQSNSWDNRVDEVWNWINNNKLNKL